MSDPGGNLIGVYTLKDFKYRFSGSLFTPNTICSVTSSQSLRSLAEVFKFLNLFLLETGKNVLYEIIQQDPFFHMTISNTFFYVQFQTFIGNKVPVFFNV